MAMALEGIKVVDVSQVAAVPMAARHLADFGADVIHIEHPQRGDSWRVYQAGQGVNPAGQGAGGYGAASDINYNWENFNRNKKSVTVDLSQEGGQQVIYKLLENADVFVSNLRPSELERYKLEYDTLCQINPRLIYGCLTGYGRKGPDKNTPAYDVTSLWARSEIPYMLSLPGVPCSGFRAAFGDNVAALALAYGVMTALFVRERTGVGQEVDVALLHVGLYQLSFDIAGALVSGQDYADWIEMPPPELVAEAEAATERIRDFYKRSSPNPLAAFYRTKDERLILMMALQPDRYWSKFCRAIDREDLEHDPRFSTFEARVENRIALYEIIDEAFLSRTLEEWKVRLEGIPFGVFQNLVEAINDPQAKANDFFVAYDHPTYGRMEVVANPVKLSKTPATIRMPAPTFSQHTEEVLLEHGFTWEDIVQLKDQGIIA